MESRTEKILRSIIDDTQYSEAAQSRVEKILLAIKNDTQYSEPAQSRIEAILLAIKNDTQYSEPAQSRIEAILLAKLNETEYNQQPRSRIEELLIEWIDAGGVIEGIPPLTYRAIEGTLKNYRIYGNTVDGESVGDKTENLWNVEVVDNYSSYSNGKIDQYVGRCTNIKPIVVDGSSYILSYSAPSNASCIVMIKNSGELISRVFKSGSIIMIDTSGGNELYITWIINDTTSITSDMIQDIMLNIGSTPLPYEPYGYKMPVTVEGKNLLQNTATSQTKNGVTFTVNADKSITCNGTTTNTIFFAVKDNVVLESGTYVLTGCPLGGGQNTFKLYAQTAGGAISYVDEGAGTIINYKSKITILITILSGYTCNNLTFYPMIRKVDIEDDTYEPYHEPITTNLYLPQPLRMSGDEADYIDFKEQKIHFADGTSADVTLPALPTILGTNLLSVNTEVQPSKVYVKSENG